MGQSFTHCLTATLPHFLGNNASRFAACQTNTAATVAICFMSFGCTRSRKSMFVWCVRELYS